MRKKKVSKELAKAQELVEAGDVRAAMGELRVQAGNVPPGAIAPLVERLARLADMDDLAAASAALAAAPTRAQELYDYGYACVDRGASFLAVPALREALRLAPNAPSVLFELVSALEDEEEHAEALALLQEREAGLPAWPGRYLLAYNALMAGELETAHTAVERLPEPVGEDEGWQPAYARVHRILDRAAAAQAVSPLDRRDLRGWHFVLTGGLLATLSTYGWDAGMTGRWGFLQDSTDRCLLGLRRLRLVLDAAGYRPRSVSLLQDRSSHILGLAAAQVLELPAEPYEPGRPDTVVVAYDLNEVEDETLAGLRDRVPGQVLHEQATCWTRPPAVSADACTLLAQNCVAPWEPQLRMGEDGMVEKTPADSRPAEEVAADIVAASIEPDPGDGETPPDPDDALAAMAARLAGQWLSGPRERVPSPGPVPSNRFT